MTTRRAKSLLIAFSIGSGEIDKKRNELTVYHSLYHQEFCEQKVKMASREIERRLTIQNGGGGYYFSISHPYLKFVRKWLYKNNRKVLTMRVLRRLTDEAIAIWYMDKGYLSEDGTLSIETFCQTDEEAQVICDFFRERYEVEMRYQDIEGKLQVFCERKSAEKLIAAWKPFAVEAMARKFKIVLS